eukprot:jgi/Bigna1/84903/estExt_fgenesh1_pg.C_10329
MARGIHKGTKASKAVDLRRTTKLKQRRRELAYVPSWVLAAPIGNRKSKRLAAVRRFLALKAEKASSMPSWALKIPNGERKSQRLAVHRVKLALEATDNLWGIHEEHPNVMLMESSEENTKVVERKNTRPMDSKNRQNAEATDKFGESDGARVMECPNRGAKSCKDAENEEEENFTMKDADSVDTHSVDTAISNVNPDFDDQKKIVPTDMRSKDSIEFKNNSFKSVDSIMQSCEMSHVLLGDNHLDFPKTPRLAERKQKKIFRDFSSNSDKISRSAFKKALSKAGRRPKANLLNSVFCSLDINKNGSIEFEEFQRGLHQLSQLSQPNVLV